MTSPTRWYIGGSSFPLLTMAELMAKKLRYGDYPDWLKEALKTKPMTRKQAIDRHNARILNQF